MKNGTKLISLLLCILMISCLTACGGNNEETAEPDYTNVPLITLSPDGAVTAGPTATPETAPEATKTDADVAVFTDVPVITRSPEGEVTAGPTATPKATEAPAATETGAPTEYAYVTVSPLPSTDAPVVTGNTPEPASTEDPRVPHPDAPNAYIANYVGESVDLSELNEGDTFYWTLSLGNENSSLYAGLWLVEFPDEFIEPVSGTDLWEGSLKYLIDEAYDNEEPVSDRPEFIFNVDYEGMTGANPYGKAGSRYTLIGMYVTSFDFCGVQSAGPMVRIRYRLIKKPSSSDLLHDENGDYLPLYVTVQNSSAMTETMQTLTHGTIGITDGRLYFGH